MDKNVKEKSDYICKIIEELASADTKDIGKALGYLTPEVTDYLIKKVGRPEMDIKIYGARLSSELSKRTKG